MIRKLVSNFSFFIQFIILLNFITLLPGTNAYDDYTNHPCIRNCDYSIVPMECEYNFTVEMYSVLSRECLNCTNNKKDCYEPDCVTADGFSRIIRVVNKMLPGPGIQVCKNDLIIVNVQNKLNSFETISIHWHGLRQFKTVHLDGVAMLTQCPILPGTTFQYKFRALDRGTYFWHAHSSLQRADGVFGPLIIREKDDPNAEYFDKDYRDHVVVLNDWLNELTITRYNAFLHSNGSEEPSSILINGRGVIRNGNESVPAHLPRAVFTVEKGQRYRFRVINAGIQYCPLEFSIEKHSLQIIATDGQTIEPVKVSSFVVSPGERVDFVLNTHHSVKNYWIKVKGLADCQLISLYQTAVLRYEGAPKEHPKTKLNYDVSGPDVEGQQLNPLNTKITQKNQEEFLGIDEVKSTNDEFSSNYIKKIASRVDKKFYLGIDMNYVLNTDVYNEESYKLDKSNPNHWTSPQINNITHMHPSVPLVYQQTKLPKHMFCNEENRDEACPGGLKKFCQCIYTYNVDLNDVVEVVIADGGTQIENHPLHLHGYKFALLGVEKLGNSTYLKDIKRMDKQGLLKRNFKSPPLKDTIMVPSGGYVIFRFYANNPGVWFFHCHIEFHHHSGMGLLFKVGEESDLPPKPDGWPTCGNYPRDLY